MAKRVGVPIARKDAREVFSSSYLLRTCCFLSVVLAVTQIFDRLCRCILVHVTCPKFNLMCLEVVSGKQWKMSFIEFDLSSMPLDNY